MDISPPPNEEDPVPAAIDTSPLLPAVESPVDRFMDPLSEKTEDPEWMSIFPDGKKEEEDEERRAIRDDPCKSRWPASGLGPEPVMI
jgi:hypothetical protein